MGTLVPDSTRVAESSGYPALDSAAVGGAAGAPVLAGAPAWPARRRRLPAADSFPESADPEHPMTPPHLRPYDSVLETIGWTPLIRLGRIGAGLRTPIYGKAEYVNPGGSVKDRIGLAIIEDAERRGELRPGGTIVEGTSGNTGVGLAIAASIKGYRCIFTMPDKMSHGEGAAAQGLRGRGRGDADGGAAGSPRSLRHEGQADREGHAERGPRQPVLQPGQPRGALRDDGPGDLAADRRGRSPTSWRVRGRAAR